MPIAADIYYHAYEGGEEGGKPPIILIHGAGGNHLYWPSEIRRLPGYRVYALDLPGHGKSDGCGQQSISMYTQSILNWLEEVDLHRAIFVGHSMGAAITLSLTLDYPEHVLGLGLIGAAARLPVATAILESSASPTTFQNAIELVTKWSFASQADPRLVELATIRMGETRPSVLNGDFVACDAFDVTARVSEIIQPALVIVGAEDRMTPPREAQFLASSLPKALLESIPNAGHMVMLEQPVAVAQALLQFFGKISY